MFAKVYLSYLCLLFIKVVKKLIKKFGSFYIQFYNTYSITTNYKFRLTFLKIVYLFKAKIFLYVFLKVTQNCRILYLSTDNFYEMTLLL